MLQTIRHFLSLIRFSHTLFALPFALMAAVMAWWLRAVETSATSLMSAAGWQEVVGILLCMVFARSAAMAFNRLVDWRIDARNPRTAGRHLPAGILSVGQVALFTILSTVGFVASTLLFLPNPLPLYLSVPVLLFLCGYSYAKRFTSLAHFWLGAALALSPIAAWIAIRGEQVMTNPADLLPPLVLAGAVLAWVAGFDILYACQDYAFDREAGLRSVPVRLGIPGALRLAAVCHAAMLLLLALLPMAYPHLGLLYWGGLVAVAALLSYEHWLVRPDDLDRVNVAFFHVNAIVSTGLLVATTIDVVLV